MTDKHRKLKVISYNIHSGKNLWMFPQIRKIKRFLVAEGADIVGMQEINENNLRGFQVSYFKKYLHMQTHFGPHLSIGNGNYGIATFSRLPIIKRNHILFEGKGEQRGLIDTQVIFQNRKLNILNTHLGLKKDDREIQLLTIRNYINQITNSFILMGDFNTTHTSLEESLMDSAKKCKKEHLSTVMLLNKRIDFVFTSNDIQVINYKVPRVKMSDHYPVVVEFTLSN